MKAKHQLFHIARRGLSTHGTHTGVVRTDSRTLIERRKGVVKTEHVTRSLPEICALDPSLTSHQSVYDFSINQSDKFWGTLARSRLQWNEDFTTVSECDMRTGSFKWFLGGKLNATVNCVDRWAAETPNKAAIIYEADDPEHMQILSFRELQSLMCRIANLLLSSGVGHGDRVILYMPMTPMAAATMLACARIGAIHSIVFAGFSAEALSARINDTGAKVVFTADQAIRGGKIIPLKQTVDEAVRQCPNVSHVFVQQRTGADVSMNAVRDHVLDKELESQPDWCEPVPLDSEHPLFLLYTSGSTGKPKGIVHSTAGYLLYAMMTTKLAFNVQPSKNDIFGCVADVGWITGHSYVVYGPLASGVTTLIFESTPIFPDPGRYWQTVQRHSLTHFYGAPTAIRLLLRYNDSFVRKYDLSSLKVLGSVGEPINHEAWYWYHDIVGRGRCMLVDTWWQTETGGVVLSPCPAEDGAVVNPSSAMRPFYGQKPVIVDPSTGVPITDRPGEGAIVLTNPWPGMARDIFGDHSRFMDTYYTEYPGKYFCGDGAHVSDQNYVTITGRLDDVINVSGHRLGTAEIEDVINEHDLVAESACVGFNHPVKGQGICAFVTLKYFEKDITEMESLADIAEDVKKAVKTSIGGFAVPDFVIMTPGLPKTRSGKIMRRILKKIVGHEYDQLGDTSTLADASVVTHLVEEHKRLATGVFRGATDGQPPKPVAVVA